MKELSNWVYAIALAGLIMFFIVGRSDTGNKLSENNTQQQQSEKKQVDVVEQIPLSNEMYVEKLQVGNGSVYLISDKTEKQRFYIVEDSKGTIYIVDHTIEEIETEKKQQETESEKAGAR